MNCKLLPWGIALALFGLNVAGARGQSYEFAVVSNSVTAGANLNAIANNGNVFVCVGAQSSPVLEVNTNGFDGFTNEIVNGGYLLFTNAWTKSPKDFWFNCVADRTNGFIAAGASNAVYVSSDGLNWTKTGNILPAGDQSYIAEGITYNQVSGTFAGAISAYEASYTSNVTNGWTAAKFQSQSFAESFRGVTSFASSNMVLCGVLGDIRLSKNGGQYWDLSQQANLDRPSLLAVASDETNWTSQVNGTNLVCVGNNSLIEVCTNGGAGGTNAIWKSQTQFNIGVAGSVTNFNAVAYGSVANSFLAAGTIGTNGATDGLIVMAPEVPNGGNWTWTRQANLWAFQNGNLSALKSSLPALNGACFANSGFFQGIALLVGNNGTVVIGGLPPLAPANTFGNNFVTNVLSTPQVNGILGTVSNANVNGDANHPTNVLTMDWYTLPANGVELATNSFSCQPPAKYYSVCGEYTNWAFGRDLRTGFTSTNATPFVFTIIPPAPIDAVTGVTNVLGSTNSAVWVDLLENAINTNFVVNWFANATGSSGLLNDGNDTHMGSRYYHTPTNMACGVYTNWAETMATNTPPSGASLVSSNRTPVTFVVVPAAPTFLANETNCANGSNTNVLMVTAPDSQTINWYNVQSGGIPLGSGPSFYPANPSPGVYTNWAEAVDSLSGLASTNRTAVIIQVNPTPLAPTNAIAQTSVLTAPYQTNSALTVSVTNSTSLVVNSVSIGTNVTVDWYMDAGAVTNAYTATNRADPNWLSGGGVIKATNTLVFIPTNRLCGTYTYYARARVINPATCDCLNCVSSNLTAVTFVLRPPAPTNSIVNVTNALAGAIQTNTPVWVALFANADNPLSSFAVNWYTNTTGPGGLLNDGTETNLNNQFFHTPTNSTCGTFTIWAETMAINSGTVSSNRIPVMFTIVPATPTAIGTFDQTNCTEVPNPTFAVVVTNGQTADWYPVSPAGPPVAGTSFTPGNSSSGTYTFAAEAVDPNSGLVSTGSVLATLTLVDCTNPVAISLNPATGTGTVQWPGNLTLLSTTNMTPPVVWTSVSTGSVFSVPFNSLTWTNTNAAAEFFRLTN